MSVIRVPPGVEVVIGAAGVIHHQRAGRGGLFFVDMRVVVFVLGLEDDFPMARDEEGVDVAVLTREQIFMDQRERVR